MLEGRLPSTLEGLLFALLVAGLFILVSVVARFAFGKKIGSPRSYAVVVVCAFALHRVLVVVFPEEPSARVEPPHQAAATSSAGDLDAPDADQGLPANLYTGDTELLPEERAQLSESLAFLAFGSQLAEQDPAQFDEADDSDRTTQALVRFYRHAQGQGVEGQSESLGMRRAQMTPKAYNDLAEQIKGLKPEWWSRFQEAKTSKRSS